MLLQRSFCFCFNKQLKTVFVYTAYFVYSLYWSFVIILGICRAIICTMTLFLICGQQALNPNPNLIKLSP